jgi:diketogulonate reductase-like aldo/keto reductase
MADAHDDAAGKNQSALDLNRRKFLKRVGYVGAITHEAIDAGVTFMDNAWEYNKHRSEEWMGQALKGRRDKVFLMTEINGIQAPSF